jgi:hypothetical protein
MELVSGKFDFIRDGHGQLWLANVTHLQVFTPGKAEPPETLLRYFSEERLETAREEMHALWSGDQDGKAASIERYETMQEKMQRNYEQIKAKERVAELLTKQREEHMVHVYVLEQTDVHAARELFEGPQSRRPMLRAGAPVRPSHWRPASSTPIHMGTGWTTTASPGTSKASPRTKPRSVIPPAQRALGRSFTPDGAGLWATATAGHRAESEASVVEEKRERRGVQNQVLATSTKQQQLLTGSGPDMKPKVATYDRLLVEVGPALPPPAKVSVKVPRGDNLAVPARFLRGRPASANAHPGGHQFTHPFALSRLVPRRSWTMDPGPLEGPVR